MIILYFKLIYKMNENFNILDIKFYKNAYEDISSLTNDEIKKHWEEIC